MSFPSIYTASHVYGSCCHYMKKTPLKGEFGVDCMFFGADCIFQIRFKLTFAEKVPSSAVKSYMPSYLFVVEITERIPTP